MNQRGYLSEYVVVNTAKYWPALQKEMVKKGEMWKTW